MKNKINSLLVIAAGFALSAAGAYGQDYVVAHIPFDFAAGGQAQSAGEYAIRQQGGVTLLRNQDTGKKIFAGIGVLEDYNPDKAASLTFTCSGAVDAKLFRQVLFAAAVEARVRVGLLAPLAAAPDHPVAITHPQGEYLKGWLAVVRGPVA